MPGCRTFSKTAVYEKTVFIILYLPICNILCHREFFCNFAFIDEIYFLFLY